MICPLVNNAQRAFYTAEMCNAVFCKYGKTETVNKFGNTVIDFRIKMIWTAGKNDSVGTAVDHLFKRVLSFLFNIFAELILLVPCIVYRIFNLLLCKRRKMRNKLFSKTLSKAVPVINRKERIPIEDRRILPECINIVAQYFRIARNNRAVVMIARTRILLMFIRSTRIEYEFHAAFNKALDMTVRYFSRIAH